MTIHIQCQARPEYLLVTMNGRWTVPAATKALDAARLEADRQGYERVLLDLRGLSKPDSEIVRFNSGRYLAVVFPSPFKVAAFANADAINGFGETAAVNRNADYRIFPEEHTAIQWLMEGFSKEEIKTTPNEK